MTDEQLAELERLADAATPGPWEANSDHHNNVYVDAMNQGELGLKVQLLDLNMQGNEEDAAFIAASRAAIPALLADLREARASLDATERELERWRHGVTTEGDFVCPDSLRLDEARRLLERAHGWLLDGDYNEEPELAQLNEDIAAALGKVG